MRTDPPTTQAITRFLRQALLGVGVWTTVGAAWAQPVLPSGGQVVSGQASIEANNGSMTVRQSTNQAIVNWDTFNVGRDQSVQFIAPSAQSTTFNRILDANPSQIMGRIQANGQLIFSNPQGVVFGATAQVDVGGLVVTVHNLSNDDFLAGRWHFTGGMPGARVENAGRLQAELGGYIALLAAEVRNDGVVLAREGTVAMAAGEAVTLQFAGSRRLSVVVDAAVMNALVSNRHVIRADGGVVVLSARSANAILESVIQQSGQATAQSLVNQNGRILLQGGERGVVAVEGQLDARGAEAGTRGGEILITGDKVFVGTAARLEASGPAGGGDVLVGGGWQGQDPRINSANAVVVAPGARLDASASEQGDGGTVVVWSDTANPQGVTRVAGDLRARGGPQGGDGGRIETSGANLDVQGVTGDASAPMGVSGEWLFDPYNVTITSAANAPTDMTSNPNEVADVNGSTWTPSADSSTILNTTINTLLNNNTNVTVTTGLAGSPGTQAGDIVVNAPITRSSSSGRATLSLIANQNITINQAINIAGSGSLLELNAGGSTSDPAIGFRAPVTVDTMIINASGTGAINQGAVAGAAVLDVTNLGINAPLAAVNLRSNQVADPTLTIANSIGTIAANVKSLDVLARTGVSVANASHGMGVYVGTVRTLSGLSTTGTITGGSDSGGLSLRVVDTNLYVNSNVVAGGNLVLNAGSVSGAALAASSAANIIVSDTASISSISTVGQGLLYTGAVAQGSTNLLRLAPAGLGRFRYNSNEGSAGYDRQLESTGLHVIYREQPTLTASIGSLSRTYGSIGSLTPSIAGLLNGDSQALAYTVNPSVSVVNNLTSTSGNTRVGTYSLTVSTGTSALGYAVVGGSGSLEVTKRPLTTSAVGNNRVYDQSSTASAALSNDAIATDKVISKAASASFLDKNVANNKPVTVVGINISGTEAENADAGNYEVANTTASTTANITPLGITAVYAAQNKVYDGTDTAAVTANVPVGILSGDTVSAVASGTFSGKNVGTAKAVSVTAGALTGTDAGNYSVSNPTATVNANITAKTVGLSAAKVYDGDTALTGSEVTITTGVGTETLGFSSATASNKNVATAGKFISAITLADGTDGGLASNYQLPTLNAANAANAAVSITAKPITVTGVTASTKVYDATRTANVSTAGVKWDAIGRETGDDLTFASVSGLYDNKNVGATKTVTLTSTYSGTSVSNYAITSQPTTTAGITVRNLSVTALADNKIYDATTAATYTLLSDKIATDSLVLSSTSGVFINKNVGTGKTVTVAGIAVAGTDAGNYQLVNTSTQTLANVSARTIQLNAMTAQSKVYDGNTSGIITGSLSVTPLLNDDLTLSASGAHTVAFSDKDVEENKTVTVTNPGTLAGADAGNYTLNPTATTTASITPKSLTISGITASDKVYQGNAVAQIDTSGVTSVVLQQGGLVKGDAFAVAATGTFRNVDNTADDKNVGVGKTVALTSTYSGADFTNYNITGQSTTTATITAKPITVAGITASSKVYDATSTANVSTAGVDWSSIGRVTGDDLSFSTVTGLYPDKNIGTSRTVTLNSSYSGADVNNYAITSQATTTADVTPRSLTIVGVSALNKFYDGSNVAFANVGSSTLSGLVAGDDVLLSSSGVFLDAAVGGNKQVLLTNTLAGNDLSNYSVTNQDTTSASIFERVSIPVVPTTTQTVVQFSPTTVRFVPQPVAVTSAAPAVTLPVSATSQPSSVAAAGVSATVTATTADAGTSATTATQTDTTDTTATTATTGTTAAGTSPVASTPAATDSVAATVAEAVAQTVQAIPASAATLPATALSNLPTSVAQSIPAETLQAMSPVQISSVLAALDPAQASALTTEQVAQVGDLFAAASDALGASTTASAAAATATPAALQQASPGEVLALLPSLPAEARVALAAETLEAVQALISQALEAEKPTSESMGLGVGSRLAGASLPLSEVPQLTSDALLALTALDMAAWDAAALQQLTAAQVATLPAETLAGLSAAQLAALDAAQLQGLSASQLADVATLLTPAQLADLTTAQKTAARDVLASTAKPTETSTASSTGPSPGSAAQEVGITSTQAAASISTLPGATSSDLASLLLNPTAPSVDRLTALPLGTWQQLDPLIIQQLSPTVISIVPSAAMATWSPEQISALRGAQLSALSIPQLRVVYLLLAPAQVAQLPAAQVAGLRLSQRFVWVSRVGRNPGLLQSLLAAVKREAGLVETQNLADLGPRDASRLSAVSIQQLGSTQIALLRPAVFSALSDQQVRAFRPEQIALLNPNQLSSVLPWLSSGQVRAITPDQLRGLRNLAELN